MVSITSKIVYSSDAYIGLKSTINDMSQFLIDFERSPGGAADQRLLDFAHLIRPWTFDGLRLVRVGGKHDGGYVMADNFAVSGAISIGVGRDVSWDKDVALRGVPVVMFDPTVRRPPEAIRNARFFRVGLGPSGCRHPFAPLDDLTKLAGMENVGGILLKVDIEGGEWEALAELTAIELSQFSQIILEFHDLKRLKDLDKSQQVLSLATTLFEGHLPIHVHANNYDNLVRFDTYWFPNAIEVTYMSRSGLAIAEPASKVSLPIDSPCDPRVDEIHIEALGNLVSDRAGENSDHLFRAGS